MRFLMIYLWIMDIANLSRIIDIFIKNNKIFHYARDVGTADVIPPGDWC